MFVRCFSLNCAEGLTTTQSSSGPQCGHNKPRRFQFLEQNKVETMTSVQKMVEAANYALETGQVEQVIIMQHYPRWDTHGAKPLLAKLANNTLVRMVDESG